ncbi:MAG TPA: phosphoribosylglycinamide formyltransferase [Xanthobacteraceae bacterium]|nr:phosphoribosylglycinamide formyltransferase [Xanthobacteraceae bacterium]
MLRQRVAILISGRGSNMVALIEAAKAADYPAEIVLVISNRPDAGGLASAQAAGIATQTIDHKKFASREKYEQQLQHALEANRIDIICLAGFMRLLTPWLVSRWTNRMINIHPALLPSYKGLDTHARALADGVKIHGATVHFVVPEMDSGPIIVQGAIGVRDNDTPETLAARVIVVEHEIYATALKLVAAGKVSVVDGRCVIAGATEPKAPLISPAIAD